MSMEKISWFYPDPPNFKCIDLNNKDEVVGILCNIMLQRTLSMFEWKGLPKTIPQDVLELSIQTNGSCGIVEKDGKHFASVGSFGGIRNYNYRPTRYIISNPYLLNGSRNYRIYYMEDDFFNDVLDLPNYDGDCVVIENDPLYMGLLPLFRFYATQLAENLQTKRLVTILTRASWLFVSNDEDDKDDFIDFMDKITDGAFSAICSNDLLARVKTLPFAEKGHEALTNLIEDQQYIKASWFNDIGLQANYNMKRESINSSESQLNKDAIIPLVDSMLRVRRLACERINEKFGLNISVDFNSAWRYTRQGIEQAIDAIDQTTDMKQTAVEEQPNPLGGEEDVEPTEKKEDDA